MTIPSFISEKNDFLLITLNVHPSSTQKRISITNNAFDIYVKEPPDKGKANKAVIKFLSKYFDVPSSSFSIVKGHKSKIKIISVTEDKMEGVKTTIVGVIN
ncbi:MAG: DUF167 domain-containing protein [Candidatus Heimdallarchaeota archaeon]|nr:DUF167 domain-containing protein [Candidatus Heimdallarchaeota archaeon]